MQALITLVFIVVNTQAQQTTFDRAYDSPNTGPLVYIDKPIPLGGYEAILKEFIYPESAIAENIEGRVTINCIIDIDGYARHVRAVLGPKQLMRAAENAVELSHWNPGRLHREPVALKVEFELDVRLSEIIELQEIDPGITPTKVSTNLMLGSIFFGIIFLTLSSG